MMMIQALLLNTLSGLLLHSTVFSVLGIIVLFITFWVFEKITPENLWQQIIEKQNVALAIIFAAVILGVSIIIAASLHG